MNRFRILAAMFAIATSLACEAPSNTVASAARVPVGTFAGEVDAQAGTVTLVVATDRAVQALMTVPVSTGTLGPDTVTIASANRTLNCAGYADGSICVDVSITSHFAAGPMRNVYFQIESMTPDGTNVARNSDAPLPGTGLNATYGLWSYGVIAPLGVTARQWVFDTRSGTTSFRFFGNVYADPPCAANGANSNCSPTATCQDTATDVSHCGYCGNACPDMPGSSPACVGRACSFVCNANRLDCDGVYSNGCEVHRQTDSLHCGTCATVCGVGQTCTAAHCH